METPAITPRPWYRPRNVILGLIAVGVVWIGWQVYLALTARPGVRIDYGARVGALVESGQPVTAAQARAAGEPEDAWPLLLRASDLLGEAEFESEGMATPEGKSVGLDYAALYQHEGYTRRDWAPVEPALMRERARQCLGAARRVGVFDALADLARTRRAVRPTQEGHLIGWLLPELSRSRQMARMLAARMAAAAEAGDWADFVAAYEQMLAIGRICAQQWTIIDHLVGVAIQSLALNQLRHAVVERPLDAATLRDLLAAMDRQALGSLKHAIEGERISVLDTIQWTHTDDGRGSGRLLLSQWQGLSALGTGAPGSGLGGLGSHPIVNMAGVAFPSKAATTKRAMEYFDRLVAGADMPYFQRVAAARAGGGFDGDDYIEALPVRYVVLKVVLPGPRVFEGHDQFQTMLGGARTMLLVELHRATTGSYPESLEQIVPTVAAALPPDPITGRAMVYRRLGAGEDRHGRAYLVYSIGRDLEDNGGTPDAKLDMRAINSQFIRGTDYIINSPRPEPTPEEIEDWARQAAGG